MDKFKVKILFYCFTTLVKPYEFDTGTTGTT